MTVVILILIIIGYVLIATKAWNNVNKTAVAIFIGVAAWLLFIANGSHYARAEHPDELTTYFLSATSAAASVKDFIAKNIFVRYITQACEVILFLLATMGIVEVLNGNKCFYFLSRHLRSRNSRRTLWILVTATFVLSANLDNLTSTVLMLVIMHKAVSGTRLRMVYGAAIAIAANCGGALTVIGDINGLTLWTQGFITPSMYSLVMAVPVLLMTLITTWLIGRMLPSRTNVPSQYVMAIEDDCALTKWQRLTLLVIGIGGLWFIPTFHNITGLPPYVGALCVLSLLWIANEVFNLSFIRSGKMVLHRFPMAVQYENIQILIFYIGITLMTGVAIETGVVLDLSTWLLANTDNIYLLGAVGGLVSTVLDSVIVVLNNTALFSVSTWKIASQPAVFGLNGVYWPLLNYFCLFGSTLLSIGTMGGIMLMRMENVSLSWYIRKITPKVVAGGVVGMVSILIITICMI